jgi:hypothetical protein
LISLVRVKEMRTGREREREREREWEWEWEKGRGRGRGRPGLQSTIHVGLVKLGRFEHGWMQLFSTLDDSTLSPLATTKFWDVLIETWSDGR